MCFEMTNKRFERPCVVTPLAYGMVVERPPHLDRTRSGYSTRPTIELEALRFPRQSTMRQSFTVDRLWVGVAR